jgi:hypothetical protein
MAHQVRILHDPTQKTIRMHYASKLLCQVILFILVTASPCHYSTFPHNVQLTDQLLPSFALHLRL